jgi:hypothetical protein
VCSDWSGSTDQDIAAMGGVFEFAKCASANLREKEDTYNSTIGGFFAGSVLGLRGEGCTHESTLNHH